MTEVPSIFDTYRQDAELTIRMNGGVTLSVAKAGGGTLFKEYSGDWFFELRLNDVLVTTAKMHTVDQINHMNALYNYTEYLLDEYEENGGRPDINSALEEFFVHGNYEVEGRYVTD